jgi:hypothetical protein
MAWRQERELVSANLLGSHKVRYSGQGHSDPLDPAIYNTGCNVIRNRETGTCESLILW